MNCPNCKNPINDNVTICEWCGTKIHDNQNKENSEGNRLTNDLDTELMQLLAKRTMTTLQGEVSRNMNLAVWLYKTTTGKSRKDARYYVARLEFFRTHKFANEDAWQLEWKRQKRINKRVAWVIGTILVIAYIIFFIALFAG